MSLYKNNRPLLRIMLRQRDGDSCSICGKPIDFTLPPGRLMGQSVEHVIPKAAGGTDHIDNLRLAHANPCNKDKGAVYAGRDHGRLPSPYGIGKHYRHPSQRRFGSGAPPVGDWDTPVMDCMPLFESWSAATA